MKHLDFPISFLSLLFSSLVLLLCASLHYTPQYDFLQFTKHGLKNRGKLPIYSMNYIKTVKKSYINKIQNIKHISLLTNILPPDDSLFFLSLKQITQNIESNPNPYPIIYRDLNKNLNLELNIPSKKRFNIQIHLKYINGLYVFDSIRNFDSLLEYNPYYWISLISKKQGNADTLLR